MSLPPIPSEEDLRSSQWNPWVITSVAAIFIFIVIFIYLRIFKQLYYAQPGDPNLLKKQKPKEEKKEEEEGRESNTECAVCLGEFKQGEWLRHLPNCSHAFHISCIDTWFQFHSSCPLCRSDVQDVSSESESFVSGYSKKSSFKIEQTITNINVMKSCKVLPFEVNQQQMQIDLGFLSYWL
ncbi:hypothetical protein UlMin_013520 [Ulmus minor]